MIFVVSALLYRTPFPKHRLILDCESRNFNENNGWREQVALALKIPAPAILSAIAILQQLGIC